MSAAEKAGGGRSSDALSPGALALLGFSLGLPSLATVIKFGGMRAVVGYIAAMLTFVVAIRYVMPVVEAKLDGRHAIIAIVLVFVAVTLVFLVVYPIANSHVAGKGSDSDDALDQATQALLHSRYPYRETTYLNNQISPLPGAILLAAPFVLIFGKSAVANIFWLIAFAVYLARARGAKIALLGLVSIVGISVGFDHSLIIGSDYVANGLGVCLGSMMLWDSADRPDWRPWTYAALFGLTLAWRANFVLILPLLFPTLSQRSGWGRSAALLGLSCAVFGLVVAPFWIYEPRSFSPIHTADKLRGLGSVIPHPLLWIPGVTAAIAVILGIAGRHPRRSDVLRDCTIVLAFPIVAGVVLRSLVAHRLDLEYALFGTLLLPFGVLSAWLGSARRAQASSIVSDCSRRTTAR